MKAVIVYLAHSIPHDIRHLRKSLALLDKHFNNRFHYPVLVFHENIDAATQDTIRWGCKSQIRFEQVQFELPAHLNRSEIPETYNVEWGSNRLSFSIGYRHMCRFFSWLIYQHPALDDYEWYWRLDTDSFLLGDIDYDVFSFMQERNYEYGYIDIQKDHPAFVVSLWDVTRKYMEDNKIKPTFLHRFTQDGVWDNSYYYTNFEISKLSFWRSDPCRRYIEQLDRAGGVYKYRWGDTPIHLLAVAMFMREEQTHLFADIPYRHQTFVYLSKGSVTNALRRWAYAAAFRAHAALAARMR